MLHKDLTKEQLIEITELISEHYIDNIVGEYSFKYSVYDDSVDAHMISFVSKSYANQLRMVVCVVYEDLSISLIRHEDKDGSDMGTAMEMENMYKVYETFRDWGIYPNIKEQRDKLIEGLL